MRRRRGRFSALLPLPELLGYTLRHNSIAVLYLLLLCELIQELLAVWRLLGRGDKFHRGRRQLALGELWVVRGGR